MGADPVQVQEVKASSNVHQEEGAVLVPPKVVVAVSAQSIPQVATCIPKGLPLSGVKLKATHLYVCPALLYCNRVL